jgi:type VI secretion system protein ImpG
MMQDTLLTYYERELAYLRLLGQEFAQSYPKIASRLLLEPGKCEDPHVERLIQSFAFLAARIQRKIEDEFPEITDALLGVLYPHYLAPIPSMSIVEFMLDPEQGKLTAGYLLPAGTQLFSRPVEGVQCRFRTCYSLTLWPIEVVSAKLEPPEPSQWTTKAAGVLRLELQTVGGVSFQELSVDRLRFYLQGENQLAFGLYELLLNNAIGIRGRLSGGKAGGRRDFTLPLENLHAVGFESDEGLLPYPPHALLGYRLLQEYFTFPQKFLFIELEGLRAAAQNTTGTKLEVLIGLNKLPRQDQAIGASNFKLTCVPVVNLFDQLAEPVRVDHTQFEYRIIPDIRRPNANEIYAVNSVRLIRPDSDAVHQVEPIYSMKHSGRQRRENIFWSTTRRQSERKDDLGTEVYISLVDPHFDFSMPEGETLSIEVTCTNRDLPGRLPADDARGDFELEGAAPVSRIRSLIKPTPTLRPPLSAANRWRLISHLSLNYLSIGTGSPEALQEILKLYDFSDSAVIRQQIEGLTAVESRRVVRRPSSMGWHGFCRGMEVTLTFDESKFVGSGAFLFASILERFLGLYAHLNSFVQCIARSQQREKPIKTWPPRAGDQVLL